MFTALSSTLYTYLLSLLSLYGYGTIFFIAFIAAALFPLPATTLLVAASGLAAQGYFSIYLVALTSLIGNILGDVCILYLVRTYGVAALAYIGARHTLTSRTYLGLRDYVSAFPRSLIFFSRFMTEANSAVNILAGIIPIPLGTYFTGEIIGQCAYVIVFCTLGYTLGSSWENNTSLITSIGLFMLSFALITNGIQYTLFSRRRSHTASTK